MSKPTMLPPVLRDEERYIAFHVISEKPVDFSQLSKAIWVNALNLLGDLGASASNMWLIRNLYDEDKQMGLIKCKQENVEEIRAAATLVNFIEETKTNIHVLGVTGTIKSAKRKYLKTANLKDF